MSQPEVPTVIFIGPAQRRQEHAVQLHRRAQGRDLEFPRHVHQAHPQPGQHRGAAPRRRRPARDLFALHVRPGRTDRPDPPVLGEARPHRQRGRRLDPQPRPRADAGAGRARLSDGRRSQHDGRGRAEGGPDRGRQDRAVRRGSGRADHRGPRPRRQGAARQGLRSHRQGPIPRADPLLGRCGSRGRRRRARPAARLPGRFQPPVHRRQADRDGRPRLRRFPRRRGAGIEGDRRPGQEGHREGPRGARLRGHLGGTAPPGHEALRGGQPHPPRPADDLGQEDRRRPHASRLRLRHPGRGLPGLLRHHLQGRQPARSAPARALRFAQSLAGVAARRRAPVLSRRRAHPGRRRGRGHRPAVFPAAPVPDVGARGPRLSGPGGLPPRCLHAPDRPPRQVGLALHPGLRLQRPGHRLDPHPRVPARPRLDLAPHPLHPVLGPDDHRPGPGGLLPGPVLGHGLLCGQPARRGPRRLGHQPVHEGAVAGADPGDPVAQGAPPELHRPQDLAPGLFVRQVRLAAAHRRQPRV